MRSARSAISAPRVVKVDALMTRTLADLSPVLGPLTPGQASRLAAATLARLAVLSVVAVGIAVAFWPDGIGLLLGLAVFRLIALVMTTIPLLKELKAS